MVKFSERDLDSVFSALADETRRGLVRELAKGPRTVSDLWQPEKISLPGLTKHIRVLEQAGLIRTQKAGRTRTCELSPNRLKTAEQWCHFYSEFWSSNLDSLSQYLSQKTDPNKDQT